MVRDTFHHRFVDRCADLQRIVDVLKHTGGLLSSYEIMKRIEEHYGITQLNIATSIGEIKKNEGYRILSVRPKKRTEHHRYALLAAPGWENKVLKDERSVKIEVQIGPCDGPAFPRPVVSEVSVDFTAGPRTCMTCGKNIPGDGPPFCKDNNDQCKNAFFNKG
jgi:hypothetical protein